MCYRPEDYSAKLVSLLGRISNIGRAVKVHKKYDFNKVNMDRARRLYNMVSFTQKSVLRQLGKDLFSSKEFTIKDVLIYAVMYRYNTGNSWTFDNLDYIKLKEQLKKIHKLFLPTSYIGDLTRILNDLETKEYTAVDLARINSKGTSVIFRLYDEGTIILPALVRISHFFEFVDLSGETKKHKEFRKMLILLNSIILSKNV